MISRVSQWFKAEKLPLLLVFVAFIFLTIITWNKYGNLASFDNSKEVVLPWLMSKGVSLYNEISYIYGPLPLIYFTAMVKLFGVKLEIFYYTGLFLVITYSIVFYAVSRVILSRFSSVIATLLFLVQLAFFHTGMLNFVFPYYYGAVIGSLLAIVELLLITLHIRNSEQKIYLWLAALITIICFVIKQDFFLSCLGILVVYFLLMPLRGIASSQGKSAKSFIKKYLKTFSYLNFIKIISFTVAGSAILFFIIAYNIGIDRAIEGILPLQMAQDKIYIELTRDIFRAIPTIENIIEFMKYGITVPIVLLFIIASIYLFINGINKKNTREATVIIIIMLILIAFKYNIADGQNESIIDWVKLELITHAKDIYYGINLWIIAVLIYTLYRFKEEKNLIVILYCFAALLMDYRMFFRLNLGWFAFYYLPVAIIIFCYILSELLKNIAILDKKINLKYWELSIKILMVFLVGLYSLLLFNYYALKTIKANTPYGITYFYPETYHRYDVINRASKYVKYFSEPSDTILAYPGLTLAYLLSDRIPASRHHFAIPAAIVTEKQQMELINDIINKKPRFILIGNEQVYRCGQFGSADFYPEILRLIKKNYTVVHKTRSKSANKDTMDIDIYQYKNSIKNQDNMK